MRQPTIKMPSVFNDLVARPRGKARGALGHRFAANDLRAGGQATRRERLKEDPETLRDIARRARDLASALSDPDRSRILEYVGELEAEASAVHGGAASFSKTQWPEQGSQPRN